MLSGKTSCRCRSRHTRPSSVAVCGDWSRDATKAALSAPTEMPTRKSGVMPRSYSASSIPTCNAPRPAPPERTNAVRGLEAPPVASLCGRSSAVVVIALPRSRQRLHARQLMRETGVRQVPNAAHPAGVRRCCALLTVERRLICLERQRLAERARGPPDAIRGADCGTLGTPLRVSGDSCVDARASAGGAPDHGAYLNGWRHASAALTGGTTNASSPSHRMSWQTIWVCPVSRSHSTGTVRPSPRRASSSTNIERPHGPTASREFLGSGACEHFPTLE